jgi:hypothetical protein
VAEPQVELGGRRASILAWCGGPGGAEIRYVVGRADRRAGPVRSIPGAACGVFLRLAVGPGGVAVAGWHSAQHEAVMSRKARGRPFAPARTLSPALGGIPGVAVSASGHTGVLWSNDLGFSNIRARIDSGPFEEAPCAPNFDVAFDPRGRLAAMDTDPQGVSRVCTRIGRGRWRTERLPADDVQRYAASPGAGCWRRSATRGSAAR